MIKLPEARGLSSAEQFALDLLVDLSRLVPASPLLEVTRLEVSNGQNSRDLRGWEAAGWGIEVADAGAGSHSSDSDQRSIDCGTICHQSLDGCHGGCGV